LKALSRSSQSARLLRGSHVLNSCGQRRHFTR